MNLLWHEFRCDAYSSGLGIDVTSPIVELLMDNDMVAYETAADFKSGKPLASIEQLSNKSKMLKLNVIKNSLSNVVFFREKGQNIHEIQKILKARKRSSKTFFNKFDLVNPFKLIIIYGWLH